MVGGFVEFAWHGCLRVLVVTDCFCLCLCWVACLFGDCWLLLGFGAVLVYLVVGGGCFTCLLVDCCGLTGWVVWFLVVVSTDLFVSI